jgi:hypothetical protein
MNPSLISALLFFSLAATAQQSSISSLTTSINEDGKTMSIQVDGVRNGKALNYKLTFNTANLNHAQQEALKNRILDSLGIGQPANPPTLFTLPMPSGGAMVQPPQPPTPSDNDIAGDKEAVTFRCESCTGKIKLSVMSASEDYSFQKDTKIEKNKRFFPYQLLLEPGDYRLVYHQNGVLQIQSTFTVKKGEDNTVVVK